VRHIVGKTAVVTGASSGIGAAVARALGEAGAKLVLAARRKERLDALVAEIEASGGVAVACPTDVTDEDQVDALFEGARSRFGRVDILVNNAGIADHTPTDQLTLARFREVMDANLTSAFLCARAAFKQMMAQGRGRIINVGSLSAKVSRENTPAYTASKFALEGFTRSLAVDGRKHGIAVGIFHPGMVATELVPGMFDRDPRLFSPASATADAILAMCNLPDHLNWLEGLMLPLEVPFIGRG
jgi:NAD(P)-dependent dehydrogenase (short-subunit alcohol dehydrogenase family)